MKLPLFMRNVSKRAYATAALAVATVVVPATLFAWGPASRVTFTMAHPATYVTFNSITDNPKHGDERNFVQIRNYTDNTTFGENVSLVPGKEYEVYVYYHNNASTNFNDAAHNYAGVATGAYMRTTMPATVAAGANAQVTGYVGATNAKHLTAAGANLGNQVWDEAYGKNNTNAEVALRYVPGSARITSAGAVNGKTLPDSLYTTGTALGYNALDGTLPGCMEYAGYVTYRFTVDQPNFEVQKTVSKQGAGQTLENVSAANGETVEFTLKYKNTGTTQQDGVTLRDSLPAGLEYVNGSSYFANSTTNFAWKSAGSDDVTKNGLKFGSYAPGAALYVKFSAKVTTSALACGTNTVKNIASADTQNGSKSDDATVTVTKDCPQPKIIEVCRLSDWKIVKIDEKDFNTTQYSKDIANCKAPVVMIDVCRLSDWKIVAINEKDFDSTKYSKDVSKCTPPKEHCPIPGKETLPKDSPNCKTTPITPVTPTTPTELPHTGVADTVMSVMGLGSLVAATSYYRASRRSAQN
ncbi:MAG: hypothetical protein WAQ25_03280 [Candidatus Saccharimonas sp.]